MDTNMELNQEKPLTELEKAQLLLQQEQERRMKECWNKIQPILEEYHMELKVQSSIILISK